MMSNAGTEKYRIRSAVILLVLIIAAIKVQAETPEDLLLTQVYDEGGMTLYCNALFAPGDRIRVEQIYTDRQMRNHFDCLSASRCRNNPDYVAAADDLHNFFAVDRRTELDRRGTMFNELPSSIEPAHCGYRVSFQVFDPGSSRGKIARTMLHMHTTHGLPLVGATLEVFQRWSDDYPPDAHEKKRNQSIEKIQGLRNVYIDDPSLVHDIDHQMPTRPGG